MVKSIKIVLPWPPKELSPNARVHWSKKSKAAKIYRAQAAWTSICAGAGFWKKNGKIKTVESVSVCIQAIPPDMRKRDLDNILASIKSGLDGISDALGIDDSLWALQIEKNHSDNKGSGTIVCTLNISENERN